MEGTKIIGANRQTQQQIQTQQEAVQELKKDIERIADQIFMGAPIEKVALFLDEANWDEKSLQKKIEVNPQKYLSEPEYTETLSTTCFICLNPLTASNAEQQQESKIHERCYHAFCKDCWFLTFENFGLEQKLQKMRCPMDKCVQPVTIDTFNRVYGAPLGEEKYWRIVLLNAQRAGSTIKKCIVDFPKECPFYIKFHRYSEKSAYTFQDQKQSILCMCGKMLCYGCELESHFPLKCSFYKSWNQLLEEKYNNDIAFKKFLATLVTQKCPGCNDVQEKKSGCNAVVCMSCKTGYCFLCGKNCGKDAHPHFREEGPCKDQLFTERTKPQGVTELAEFPVNVIKYRTYYQNQLRATSRIRSDKKTELDNFLLKFQNYSNIIQMTDFYMSSIDTMIECISFVTFCFAVGFHISVASDQHLFNLRLDRLLDILDTNRKLVQVTNLQGFVKENNELDHAEMQKFRLQVIQSTNALSSNLSTLYNEFLLNFPDIMEPRPQELKKNISIDSGGYDVDDLKESQEFEKQPSQNYSNGPDDYDNMEYDDLDV